MANILLGVTGGIAAYKAPDLVRRLRERGADVQVVLSAGAERFITPMTLAAVSGREVRTSLWDEAAEAAMGHIELARWADTILIAPATADVIARLAAGYANDLLTTLCLASEAELVIAPAMNHVMWSHAATQANCAVLRERGARFIGPADGDQACGETGAGRLTEPSEIAELVTVQPNPALAARRVMITAGPTREPIDPVRYLTNRSSGRMGYALAEAFVASGADVTLVSGPVSLEPPHGVTLLSVETATEMRDTVIEQIGGVDIFIGAAAIADYTPDTVAESKIKKNDAEMSLAMVRTPDTLASVAARPNAPFTVGFAAETDRVREYALGKLRKKRLDMIVANRVGKGQGFDVPQNEVTVFWNGGEKSWPRMCKKALSRELVELIGERYAGATSNVANLKGTVA